MKTLSTRNKKRLLHHHSVLAIICAALFAALYSTTESNDIKFRLSLATGYVGLALLAATLVTGALNIVRDQKNPVSTDLRRDIGIWCGVISLAHVVVGLQVHMGNMLLYFFREPDGLMPRLDLFGFANYTGLMAALVICLLLALSNDFSLRRLGKTRWKSLQRLNYAAAAMIVLHSIAYQIIEKRQLLFILFFVLIAGIPLTVQILGFSHLKRQRQLTSQQKNRRAF